MTRARPSHAIDIPPASIALPEIAGLVVDLILPVLAEAGHELDMTFRVGLAAPLDRTDLKSGPFARAGPFAHTRPVELGTRLGQQRLFQIVDIGGGESRIARAHQRLRAGRHARARQIGSATDLEGKAGRART